MHGVREKKSGIGPESRLDDLLIARVVEGKARAPFSRRKKVRARHLKPNIYEKCWDDLCVGQRSYTRIRLSALSFALRHHCETCNASAHGSGRLVAIPHIHNHAFDRYAEKLIGAGSRPTFAKLGTLLGTLPAPVI